jgi:hypothetical protein
MATKTKPAADLVYLCRALRAPSLARSIERLGERARAEGWSHEEFLAACLEREVAARQANGGELRIRAARFPARKTLEEFDFDHQASLRRGSSPTSARWTSWRPRTTWCSSAPWRQTNMPLQRGVRRANSWTVAAELTR